MGKHRRKQERAERRRLRVIQGGGEPDAPSPPEIGTVPIQDRPEYQAHMQAWRDAGEPRPTV